MQSEEEIWEEVPDQYHGRWHYEIDFQNNLFVLYCGNSLVGHIIDGKVASAICEVHNGDLYETKAEAHSV